MKETFVHKYIIANTIEEKITIFQNRGNNNNNNNSSDNNSNNNNNTSDSIISTPLKSKLKRSSILTDDSLVLSLHDFKFILDI